MTSQRTARVCALIVTFNPAPALLAKVLQGIRGQVDTVLLVDNGSDRSPVNGLEFPGAPKLEFLPLHENLGLAAAQNRGVARARASGHTHVLLMDQDSIAEPEMVRALVDGLGALNAGGARVAAVGPVYLDPRTGAIRPFVRFPGYRVLRTTCVAGEDLVPADFLIASGTLIPLDVIDDVGGFEEPLFIDNVDLEWCFRARAKGYGLYGVCSARMHHFLGDHAVRVWLGRWWHVYRHSPLRQYYMARNRLVLYRRGYSPRGWVLHDLIRFVAKFFWFGLAFPPRLRNLGMIFRGLADGWRGRLGPFSGG